MKTIWNISGEEAELGEWLLRAQDPAWSQQEVLSFLSEWHKKEDWITAQTSGTTGKPKEIRLGKEFMENSARETAAYFQLGLQSHVLLCLPAKYIGGKMMIVRALVNNWHLHCLQPSSMLELPDGQFDFASMTPMQALWLLQNKTAGLKRIKSILLGGAGVDPDLMGLISAHPSRFYLSYGMTETASHVAIRKLNGPEQSDHYEAVGPYDFSIDDRSCLMVSSKTGMGEWQTKDVVELIDERRFRFIGRADNVINSGGVKIHPEALENMLQAYIPAAFYLSSKSDPSLGERLIMIVEAEELSEEERNKIRQGIEQLHPHHRPKEILLQRNLERTDSGKLIRKKYD